MAHRSTPESITAVLTNAPMREARRPHMSVERRPAHTPAWKEVSADQQVVVCGGALSIIAEYQQEAALLAWLDRWSRVGRRSKARAAPS